MSVSVGVNDGGLKRKLNSVEREYVKRQSRKIDKWTVRLKDAIRGGDYFDNPTPSLQQRVWAGPVKLEGRTGLVGQAGWGSSYGPILEFGVSPAKQQGWAIKPKSAKGKLRWLNPLTGAVSYSKGVWHPWTHGDKGSRPHWSEALKSMRPQIEKDLAATIGEVFRGV